MTIRLGLIGDYDPQVKAHVAIPAAVALAARDLDCQIEITWLPTPQLAHEVQQQLNRYQCLWAVPATPYASMEGALNGIRYAREQALPFLGTCGGFQHLLIEFARNVLDVPTADHAESNPTAEALLVTPLICSLNERTETLTLLPGSRAAAIYGQCEIVEAYGICNYGLNTAWQSLLEQGGLRVSGVDSAGEACVIELTPHPFFLGTLFQPERSAFQHRVHPLIKALLQAARER
ncbi:MAG TPA: hypothetical protein VNE38_14395 [Ktedonobacteraceae bacterium]|nr:hypothetical protein [Ktedonobacteraceae bacterium]